MSIILSLIEEKNNQLIDYDAKANKRDALVKELQALDNELADFNKAKTVADIDELTECAVKLGLLPSSIEPEQCECECDTVEVS
jgi:hypothetical protein